MISWLQCSSGDHSDAQNLWHWWISSRNLIKLEKVVTYIFGSNRNIKFFPKLLWDYGIFKKVKSVDDRSLGEQWVMDSVKLKLFKKGIT